jgi:glycosyltransferase involved in cell wall biosynthesis
MGFFRTITRKVMTGLGIPEVSQRKLAKFAKEVDSSKTTKKKKGLSVSIIVPCYNHEKYLPQLFDSIVNQTKKPKEVIFVVDASPDNTVSKLKRLIKSNKQKGISFSIILNEINFGQAESINVGVKKALSEWIMIMNDDDYLDKNAIKVVSHFLLKYKTVHLFGFDNFVVDKDKSNLIQDTSKINFSKIESVLKTPADCRKYRNYNDINMTHSGMVFSKTAWAYVGGYFPKPKRIVNFSDRDFQLRVNYFFDILLVKYPLSYWRSYSSVDAGLNS